MQSTKRCYRCKKYRSLDRFSLCTTVSSGRLGTCKLCIKASVKKYQQSEKGKAVHLAANKRYLNTEKGKAAVRRYRKSKKGKLAIKKANSNRKLTT